MIFTNVESDSQWYMFPLDWRRIIWGFPKMGVPLFRIHFIFGFSMKETIHIEVPLWLWKPPYVVDIWGWFVYIFMNGILILFYMGKILLICINVIENNDHKPPTWAGSIQPISSDLGDVLFCPHCKLMPGYIWLWVLQGIPEIDQSSFFSCVWLFLMAENLVLWVIFKQTHLQIWRFPEMGVPQ